MILYGKASRQALRQAYGKTAAIYGKLRQAGVGGMGAELVQAVEVPVERAKGRLGGSTSVPVEVPVERFR